LTSWPSRSSEHEAAHVFRAVLASGLADGQRAWIVHDVERMRSKIEALRVAFPSNTLHAVAIKANPLVEVLREVVAGGAGLEAASFEEVHLARAAGCPPERIVFDSPAKTFDELERALATGVAINADNLDELSRIDSLYSRLQSRSVVGLRINPLVGSGSIAATSVAAAKSKFGVPIDAGRHAIFDAFARYPWLTGLHVHVGSQGCTVDQLVAAVERALDVASDVDACTRAGRVRQIDIGGGLPAAYRDQDEPPTPAQYVARLRARAPQLFDPRLRLVTEFGRAIHAGCGFAASRIEYVTTRPAKAVVHVGADLFLRTAYHPDDWHHDMLALDPAGNLKHGPTGPWTIAGPLCFAGDILARERSLPTLAAGDWLVIRDAGAYTLGMWSRHCSRGMPLVLGYRGAGDVCVLRHGESPEDVVRFWSRDPGRETTGARRRTPE
jgi:diaminopimelate decarboxylase